MPTIPPRPRRATLAEQGAWNGWFSEYKRRTVPKVEGGIASGEICAMVQHWANSHGVPIAVWTPSDQRRVDQLINAANKLDRVVAGLSAHKYFLMFSNGQISAVAPTSMRPDQYQSDRFPEEIEDGMGAAIIIPVIVLVVVSGIALIGSLWGTSKIIEAESERQRSKNEGSMIEADRQIAESSPATRQAWTAFKSQNHQQLLERTEQADAGDGGIFGTIFGSKAAKGVGIALGIAAALAGLMFLSRTLPEKKNRSTLTRAEGAER